jgi:hypothetical protein
MSTIRRTWMGSPTVGAFAGVFSMRKGRLQVPRQLPAITHRSVDMIVDKRFVWSSVNTNVDSFDQSVHDRLADP